MIVPRSAPDGANLLSDDLADHLTTTLDLAAVLTNDAATLAAQHRDRPHARLAVDLVQVAERIVQARDLLSVATP
jgi:hypothetical protein